MASINSIERRLSNNDFIIFNRSGSNPVRGDEFELNITGAVGQNLTISLSSTFDGFDPFLEVLDPITGEILKNDDDDGGGKNAQINDVDNLAVPNNGKFIIRVIDRGFASSVNAEIPYNLEVSLPVDNIEIQLKPKDTVFGNPETGSSVTINGQLNTDDFNFSKIGAKTRADEYKLEAPIGQDITIALNSIETGAFDPFLEVIVAETGEVIADSDDVSFFNRNSLISPDEPNDGSGNDNSFIPNSLTIQSDVNYIIRVTSYDDFPKINQSQAVDYELEVSTTQGEVTVIPRIFTTVPDVIISDSVIEEGNNEDTNLSFDVRLSEASNFPITVKYTTSDNTAIAGSDYTAVVDGELVFQPGETIKTINLQIIKDTEVELNETFFVDLTSATNANITDDRGVGIINNDDIVQESDFLQDPSQYMELIRDFDGNDLGASDSWKQIGSIDIQGDEDIEHIFVNPVIGRWATVGADITGVIDFSKYGQGGDTRVVGIYIDPLVEAGVVEKNSDFDSQRRFQNDLFIDNLTLIEGSGFDYDKDLFGLQEVYFRVNDGTAVLHALMHADGNIQYANYQSESDLELFMKENGIENSMWDDWF